MLKKDDGKHQSRERLRLYSRILFIGCKVKIVKHVLHAVIYVLGTHDHYGFLAILPGNGV